jgi:monothiol bacilliredoxin
MLLKRRLFKDVKTEKWGILNSLSGLDEIVELSSKETVGIFKHSTRCSISSMAKSRMENKFSEKSPSLFILDLITYREVSNAIADRFSIRHESPQLILIRDGRVIYSASHGYINMSDAIESIPQ